jgi:hypothetical protein
MIIIVACTLCRAASSGDGGWTVLTTAARLEHGKGALLSLAAEQVQDPVRVRRHRLKRGRTVVDRLIDAEGAEIPGGLGRDRDRGRLDGADLRRPGATVPADAATNSA